MRTIIVVILLLSLWSPVYGNPFVGLYFDEEGVVSSITLSGCPSVFYPDTLHMYVENVEAVAGLRFSVQWNGCSSPFDMEAIVPNGMVEGTPEAGMTLYFDPVLDGGVSSRAYVGSIVVIMPCFCIMNLFADVEISPHDGDISVLSQSPGSLEWQPIGGGHATMSHGLAAELSTMGAIKNMFR